MYSVGKKQKMQKMMFKWKVISITWDIYGIILKCTTINMILVLLFQLPCLNVLFLLLLDVFRPFFVALLAFLELFKTRLLYNFKAPLPKKYPGKKFNSWNTFSNPQNQSLKAIIAQQTPILIILLLQDTDTRERFHIKPFEDSFTFWILRCKLFKKRVLHQWLLP